MEPPFSSGAAPLRKVNGFLTKGIPEPRLLNLRLNFATAHHLRHDSQNEGAQAASGFLSNSNREMPELNWEWGHPLSIRLMAFAAIGPYVFFRWNWIESVKSCWRGQPGCESA
jgi:hypothetical protein